MIRLISWSLVTIFAIADVTLAGYEHWYKPKQKQELSLKEVEELKKFTARLMDIAPVTKLSDTSREMTINKIVSIVSSKAARIKTLDAKESYISQLKIESNFNNNARSPASAVGIAQILPSTFKRAAKDCGLNVVDDDIKNEDINILVGACYYAQVLEQNQDNVFLASAEYNGSNRTSSLLKKLGNINLESANYVTKVMYLKDLARN